MTAARVKLSAAAWATVAADAGRRGVVVVPDCVPFPVLVPRAALSPPGPDFAAGARVRVTPADADDEYPSVRWASGGPPSE